MLLGDNQLTDILSLSLSLSAGQLSRTTATRTDAVGVR